MLVMMKNYYLMLRKKKEGLGTVELVIIVAVLVGVAIMFRSSIKGFVENQLTDLFHGV